MRIKATKLEQTEELKTRTLGMVFANVAHVSFMLFETTRIMRCMPIFSVTVSGLVWRGGPVLYRCITR